MKIFLAGTFGERKHSDIVKTSPFLLESFYYIKDWQIDIISNCKDFLLDSGAFTFMSGNGKNVNLDDYLERYAKFINKYNIHNFFELDVDSITGYKKVIEYRKKLEKLTGKRCIPVWHKSRGIDEYYRMCDEYNYAAIGGIVTGEITKKQYSAFSVLLREAHKRKCKIHGLGFTNVTLLPIYHFDSVDSTRWNCARYGRLEYFDKNTMRTIDRRKEGKRIVGQNEADIIGITLTEWIKYQKYALTHL